MISYALVRPPGASFAQAISSSQAAIDVALAQAQHAEYRQALAEAGVTVEVLPPDERYPDSCFMQDPAMVIAGRAIINRPGAASRQGEEETLVELLAPRFPTTRIIPPGTLEGGDVLILPDRVVVGRSDRTNRAGIAQLVVALVRPDRVAEPVRFRRSARARSSRGRLPAPAQRGDPPGGRYVAGRGGFQPAVRAGRVPRAARACR